MTEQEHVELFDKVTTSDEFTADEIWAICMSMALMHSMTQEEIEKVFMRVQAESARQMGVSLEEYRAIREREIEAMGTLVPTRPSTKHTLN